MRTEPLHREIQSGFNEPATDIHATPVDAHENVAHAAPSAQATSGNVQDLTY